MLISKGNPKLGALPSFALPVITTCPGKTPFCEHYCYGLKGHFVMSNVKDANERRLDATLRSDFVSQMVKEIAHTRAPAFRLHVVGDFYSVEYIEKWMDIAEQLPDIAFFGSTRSWRCDVLAPPLKVLREMDNIFLKASVDLTDSLSPDGCGWCVWSVEGEGAVCPHDVGKVENCLACGRCWKKKNISTCFHLRWGSVRAYATIIKEGVS